MVEHALDIPVSELPFNAGEGFSATVKNGIAHITVSMADPKQKTKEPLSQSDGSLNQKWGNSLGDWANQVAALPKKHDISDEDKKDERYIAILKKHAPWYLEKYAPELLD